MGFHLRKRIGLGPVKLNLTNRGLSSVSIRVGRYTWNSRTRASSVDLPGPVNWRGKRRS
jgi:hypothetical protein